MALDDTYWTRMGEAIEPRFALVQLYLQTHRAPKNGPEFLMRQGDTWYVRWPNGAARWVSEEFLRERNIVLPAEGVLQPGIEKDCLELLGRLDRSVSGAA